MWVVREDDFRRTYYTARIGFVALDFFQTLVNEHDGHRSLADGRSDAHVPGRDHASAPRLEQDLRPLGRPVGGPREDRPRSMESLCARPS